MSEFPQLPAKPADSDSGQEPLDAILPGSAAISAPAKPVLNAPSLENPAVARCTNAFYQAYSDAVAAGKRRFFCNKDANNAFLCSMPPLSGQQNIQDFIACVAHGMLLEIIISRDALSLLYAAQVALRVSRSLAQNNTGTPRPKANSTAKSKK